MQSFAAALEALGEQLGIEGLSLDQQGCCRLVFDGARLLELRVASAQRRFLLSARLSSTVNLSTQAEKKLLRANLWGAGTAGGWFALDEQGQACLQQDVLLDDGCPSMLMVKIEGMLNSLETWERELQGMSAENLTDYLSHAARRV